MEILKPRSLGLFSGLLWMLWVSELPIGFISIKASLLLGLRLCLCNLLYVSIYVIYYSLYQMYEKSIIDVKLLVKVCTMYNNLT